MAAQAIWDLAIVATAVVTITRAIGILRSGGPSSRLVDAEASAAT